MYNQRLFIYVLTFCLYEARDSDKEMAKAGNSSSCLCFLSITNVTNDWKEDKMLV